MEALILLLIGVIAIPILLIISHSSKIRTTQQPKEEPGIKITVKRPGVSRLACPSCGSPVMLRGNRWECALTAETWVLCPARISARSFMRKSYAGSISPRRGPI